MQERRVFIHRIKWYVLGLLVFVHACGAQEIVGHVVVGAERMEVYLPMLEGKRVGLVVNHSSLVKGTHLVDTLLARGVQVVRLFTPEHGLRGKADAGEVVHSGRDSRTGLPVVSLYGKTKKPQPQHLEDIDVVVFDIQDVGARFYTYISTLHYVMEACAEAGIPVVVLDRPNPNGYYVDGPVLDTALRSFVGMHPVPIVYGMTIGEYARMINGEGWLKGGRKAQLQVIALEGYDRCKTYALSVPPSPNLTTLRSILLYPSLCLLEPTHVSVGRGTEHPFEVYGHPSWIDAPYCFTPRSRPGSKNPKHEDRRCCGYSFVEMPLDSIFAWGKIRLRILIDAYHRMKGQDFFLSDHAFDRIAGTSNLRKQLQEGWDEQRIRQSWHADLEAYKNMRKKYLLYEDCARR